MGENLRGLRENLNNKILSTARPLGGCHGTLDDAERHNGLAALARIQWRPYWEATLRVSIFYQGNIMTFVVDYISILGKLEWFLSKVSVLSESLM